jgi:hypothetical protein
VEAGAGAGVADWAMQALSGGGRVLVISVEEAGCMMMRLVCILLGLPRRSRQPVLERMALTPLPVTRELHFLACHSTSLSLHLPGVPPCPLDVHMHPRDHEAARGATACSALGAPSECSRLAPLLGFTLNESVYPLREGRQPLSRYTCLPTLDRGSKRLAS